MCAGVWLRLMSYKAFGKVILAKGLLRFYLEHDHHYALWENSSSYLAWESVLSAKSIAWSVK